ncbi:MAG TPA: TfoX/Sxy family protein [Alphaproteobacteria bacterium]|nr:TfoX/Sxy family protein [Alphaproteobacteria bacterium]
MSAHDDAFIAHILDQLDALGPVAVRAMFGGFGLYLHGVMFALVADETLYFKTDATNRAVFEDAGMEPFIYEAKGRKIAMSYHEAPPDALEDAETLCELARGAYAAAQRAKAAGARRPRRRWSA